MYPGAKLTVHDSLVAEPQVLIVEDSDEPGRLWWVPISAFRPLPILDPSEHHPACPDAGATNPVA